MQRRPPDQDPHTDEPIPDDAAAKVSRACDALRQRLARLPWLEPVEAGPTPGTWVDDLDRLERRLAACTDAARLAAAAHGAEPGRDPPDRDAQAATSTAPGSAPLPIGSAGCGPGLAMLAAELGRLLGELDRLLADPTEATLASLERHTGQAEQRLRQLCTQYGLPVPASASGAPTPADGAGPRRTRGTWRPGPAPREPDTTAAPVEGVPGAGAAAGAVPPPTRQPDARDPGGPTELPWAPTDAFGTAARHAPGRALAPWEAGLRRLDGRLTTALIVVACVNAGLLAALWWHLETAPDRPPPSRESHASTATPASEQGGPRPQSAPESSGAAADPATLLRDLQRQQATLDQRLSVLEALVDEMVTRSRASLEALELDLASPLADRPVTAPRAPPTPEAGGPPSHRAAD